MDDHKAGPSVLRARLPRIEEESDSDSGAYSDAASVGVEWNSRNEREEDEVDDSYAHDLKGKGVDSPERRAPEQRRATMPEKTDSSRSWSELDLSMVVALVSPVGNWLTGSDHVKNLFLLLLLIFYLHQLIEVPWQLYHNSRPRAKLAKGADAAVELAMSELRAHELFYLSFTVVAPFLGALMIRYVFSVMEGVDTLSWFSTALFVLATGIRPWSHLISRLQERTQNLHDAIRHNEHAEYHEEVNAKLQAVMKRVDSLERDFRIVKSKTERILPLQEACEDINDALDVVERNVHRQEKKTESARVTHNNRLATIEAMLMRLEENQKRHVAANVRFRRRSIIIPVPWALTEVLQAVYDLAIHSKVALQTNIPRLFLRHPKHNRTPPSPIHIDIPLTPSRHLTSTPLPTILEADDLDSDGTYVSEKDAFALMPEPQLVEKRAVKKLERVRSHNTGGQGPLRRRRKTLRHKTMDFAARALLWPYHFAVRILLSIIPVPVRKLFV